MLKSLESLNLGTNLLTSVHTGALENFSFLTRLTLRHNQIDVISDHAFSGLSSLQALDLSYNGIVAISGSSLKHLSRLVVLNLTHNFLRFVSSHNEDFRFLECCWLFFVTFTEHWRPISSCHFRRWKRFASTEMTFQWWPKTHSMASNHSKSYRCGTTLCRVIAPLNHLQSGCLGPK